MERDTGTISKGAVEARTVCQSGHLVKIITDGSVQCHDVRVRKDWVRFHVPFKTPTRMRFDGQSFLPIVCKGYSETNKTPNGEALDY